jgi:hypothetical protein
MSSSSSHSLGLAGLVALFNVDKKVDARKACRSLVVTDKDLADLILAGMVGALEPYAYVSHFTEYQPEHLTLRDQELGAIARNGVGPLGPKAQKALNKISQMFVDRRPFCAHLFHAPSHKRWHLIYFDQRDRSSENNHWKAGGPHVNYSRQSLRREPLTDVWRAVCETPPRLPNCLYIRYAPRQAER